MSKLNTISKLKEAYNNGDNIIELLKQENLNDWESIMISYDFQAGSYTKLAKDNESYLNIYTQAIADVLGRLNSKFNSIMEIGVGEATVMNPLMNKIDPSDDLVKLGFDISWSRIRYAVENSKKNSNTINLFTANLFNIPLPDNSVDIIYTSHSLEPNGGKEKEALKEIYRVAKMYVILLEPDFKNGSDEAKARMTRHGYVRNLGNYAIELGYEVITDEPFKIFINELNPTGLTIIKKSENNLSNEINFICPITKSILSAHGNVFFSSECGLMYPVINGIPCLMENSATLGLHFGEFNKIL
jgi:ubiquinone/menaquinone biosynthesis C-methylase UbiE